MPFLVCCNHELASINFNQHLFPCDPPYPINMVLHMGAQSCASLSQQHHNIRCCQAIHSLRTSIPGRKWNNLHPQKPATYNCPAQLSNHAGRVSASSSSSTQDTESQPSTSGRGNAAAGATTASLLVSFEELQDIAAARGLHLALKTLGPLYRVTCRDGGPEGRILGVTNGFVAPWFGLVHCDTLQVFTRGMMGGEGERVRKNPLGLGLLLGGAVFSYGHSCGCSKAEILAINDNDEWHERLVRYYSYFGFKPVCKVGGQGFFKDVPHLLVWGGEGTRMDADIEATLRRWTPALRQSRTRAQQPASV